MERKKVLIIDSSEEFSAALQAELQNSFSVKVCYDGKEALQAMNDFYPDALILDLLLPEMDGLAFLQRAAEIGIRPTVLVVTRFVTEYMVDAMERLGVDYVMRKPCEVAAVAERLNDLTQNHDAMPQQELRTIVENGLHKLNFPTHPRGYACLREVLLENIRNPGQQVTKTLYPAAGKLCDGNGTQVERAIRGLIKKAWLYRDEEIWAGLFPEKRGAQAECPTNKEFIAAFTEYILAEMREKNTYFRRIG